MKFPEIKMCAVACLAATQLPAGQAHAQTAPSQPQAGTTVLQEVVITAEHRTSNVQKTATSVSVRTGAELQDQGRFTLGQILEDVPGITGAGANSPTPGGSGTDTSAPGLTIRGIPSNLGAVGNVTSVSAAAAVYVDGVYEGVGGGYDIDRVEVLRGPQGTLYGRSATSGLVAIHTADPSLTHLGGNAAVEFGNYGLQHYTGAVNAPLINDTLAIRISGNRYVRDGYLSAKGDGSGTSDDGKVKLLYQPTKDISLLVGVALQNNNTGNGGITPDVDLAGKNPNKFIYLPTGLGTGANNFRQYWGVFNWDLGFAKLTYEPAYRTWQSNAKTFSNTAIGEVDTTILVPRDSFNTQELRLASDPGSKLVWQTGVLYYKNSLASHLIVHSVALNANPVDALVHDKTTEAIGTFAEGTYPLSDTWRLNSGVRYDHTKVSVNEDYSALGVAGAPLNGKAGTRAFDNFTYKVRLEHDLTPQNLVYASISTGFTPGDISVTTGSTGNPIPLKLNAETLTAYEIGSKNRFLDRRLQVNGTLYFNSYGGYQDADVNIAPPNAALTFTTLAAPAQTFGGELETIFQFTPDDRASANLAYTNARFTNRNRLVDTGGASLVPFSNYFTSNQIPNVTPFTADFGYDHIFRLPADSTLTLHGDTRYMSAHALSNLTLDNISTSALHVNGESYAPYVQVGGEWVGDLSATWQSASRRFSVTGYVRNVGNNIYKTTAFIESGQFGSSDTLLSTPSDPRTYGVVLSARY